MTRLVKPPNIETRRSFRGAINLLLAIPMQLLTPIRFTKSSTILRTLTPLDSLVLGVANRPITSPPELLMTTPFPALKTLKWLALMTLPA